MSWVPVQEGPVSLIEQMEKESKGKMETERWQRPKLELVAKAGKLKLAKLPGLGSKLGLFRAGTISS